MRYGLVLGDFEMNVLFDVFAKNGRLESCCGLLVDWKSKEDAVLTTQYVHYDALAVLPGCEVMFWVGFRSVNVWSTCSWSRLAAQE